MFLFFKRSSGLWEKLSNTNWWASPHTHTLYARTMTTTWSIMNIYVTQNVLIAQKDVVCGENCVCVFFAFCLVFVFRLSFSVIATVSEYKLFIVFAFFVSFYYFFFLLSSVLNSGDDQTRCIRETVHRINMAAREVKYEPGARIKFLISNLCLSFDRCVYDWNDPNQDCSSVSLQFQHTNTHTTYTRGRECAVPMSMPLCRVVGTLPYLSHKLNTLNSMEEWLSLSQHRSHSSARKEFLRLFLSLSLSIWS